MSVDTTSLGLVLHRISPRRLKLESALTALTAIAATERPVQGCFVSNDCKEDQAAFMDKRKPQFTDTGVC